MRLVNRAGHEVDLNDDDVAVITEYKARGYGAPEVVAANMALDAEQERARDEALEEAAEQERAEAAARLEAEAGYNGKTVEWLRGEIKTRNDGRPADQHIPGSGNKADLVAALDTADLQPPVAVPAGPEGDQQ